MGQYYKAIILSEAGEVEYQTSPRDFNSGAKLMEHSWLGNEFVEAVETLLAQEAPRRVVWAGDYADAELADDGSTRTYKRVCGDGVERVFDLNLYTLGDHIEPYRPKVPGLGERYRWVGYTGYTEFVTEVDPDICPNAFPRVEVTTTSHPFLVNWDRREYVDKHAVTPEPDGWRIHPLPLLTVEGNGRGGGDFRGADPAGVVGRWTRDHISAAAKAPEGTGWTCITFDLSEREPVDVVA
jgi:hypothetical protein